MITIEEPLIVCQHCDKKFTRGQMGLDENYYPTCPHCRRKI